MILETKTIQYIREKFSQIEDKNDLLALINHVHTLVYGKEHKKIALKHLAYYANPQLSTNRYHTFTIPKKSGGERTIQAPNKFLKVILRCINVILQCVETPHKASFGFVPQKSIVDNAQVHAGSNYVYNIDLQDFFHSFDRKWVKYGFSHGAFSLHGTSQKEEVAFLLACLCTHPTEIEGETKTVLPQGSPTSPTITNILCKKLDRRLTGLANKVGARYTRYADDITFSSMHNVYKPEFIFDLLTILQDYKLDINPKKTRLQKRGYKQVATGLTVNEKVNVSRHYIKELRQYLYFWEQYGLEKGQEIFNKHYQSTDPVKIQDVIRGKLAFLKVVKGEEDSTYKKLSERYKKLEEKVKGTYTLEELLSFFKL